jgi:transposase
MARGVRFGRPRKLDPRQRQEALQRLANGETLVDVSGKFDLSVEASLMRLRASGCVSRAV